MTSEKKPPKRKATKADTAARDLEKQLTVAREVMARRNEALSQLAVARQLMREDHEVLRALAKT